MKHKANKILSLLLSLTMLFNMLPLTLRAAALESTEGWLYEINEDNIAIITGYSGTFTDGLVEIPSRITDNTGKHTVRIINDDAFSNRTDVVTVEMTDNIDYIFGGAFKNCENLSSITLSENLKVLDNVVFAGCTSLTSLDIPKSVTELGGNVFDGCTNLQSINYGGTRSKWDAISDRAGVPEGTLINCTGQEGWSYEIDDESGDLTILEYNGTLTNACPDFVDGKLTIPTSINVGTDDEPDYRTVCWIGSEAFMEHEEITSVIIPDSVVTLYTGAFIGCTELSSVTLSNKLRRIGQGAFRRCESLETITLPKSLVEIGQDAFFRSDLKTIYFEGTEMEWNEIIIGDNAIADDVTITFGETVNSDAGWLYTVDDDRLFITGYNGTFENGIVKIPSVINVGTKENPENISVKVINNRAFKDREDIVSVQMPNSVRSLRNSVFMNCVNLKNVQLSENLRDINEYAFRGCSSLTTINIPDGVEFIGEQAFMDCESLTSITLPISVTEICSEAFANCDNLTITYLGTPGQWDQVWKGDNIADGVTVNCIGEAGWIFGLTDEGQEGYVILLGHTDPLVGEVTLPEVDEEGRLVKYIAGGAFAEQTALTKLIIPDQYKIINPHAFAGCTSLTEVVLPLEIDVIGVEAFAGCDNLTKVIYPGREDRWNNISELPHNAFDPHNINDLIVFGDDGFYSLSGTVKNSIGDPISGATVTLTREDGSVETVTTLEDGIYQFEDLNNKVEYLLTASAAGYPSKKVIYRPEQDDVFDFVFFTEAEYAANIDLAHLREDEIQEINSSIAEGTDNFVLSNIHDALTSIGENGTVLPALAEFWSHNGDYTQWTFKIRDNANWVDINGNVKGTVTAADFATAIEWRLNAQKNPYSQNNFMLHEQIIGAESYTDWTDRIAPEYAWELNAKGEEFCDIVGVSVDEAENSITFDLIKPVSYFPTVMAGADYMTLYPMSEDMIQEIGLFNVNEMSYTQMWYCGPYILKEFVRENYKVYEPNPYYWDLIDGDSTDCQLFERVVIHMVDSYDEAFELFEAGQLDYVEIDGNIANQLINDGSEYSDNLVSKVLAPYSYQMHWNYNKYDPDMPILDENGEQMYDRYSRPMYELDDNWNTAIANEDFRLSLYYGWELTNYYARTNPVDPLKAENYTNTLDGTAYLSDGTDYTELVKQKLGLDSYTGDAMVRYNQAKAEQHKAAAKEALLKQGVTLPVEIDYYVIDDSLSSQERLAILRNCLTQSLGEDYVTINICTYKESLFKEVRDPQFQSIAVNGFGLDYMDPYNNLSQFGLDDNSYYSHNWNNIVDLWEYTPDYAQEVVGYFSTYVSMLEAAEQLTDDARLNKLAEAEAYLISHGLVIPCIIDFGYCIGYIDPASMTSHTMKNWKLSDTLISGGVIHNDGIIDMGIWKPHNNYDHVFDWILTDDGTLYITGNGSLEGVENNGSCPWMSYKNSITKIVISSGVTGLDESGAFKQLEKVAAVEFGKYTTAASSAATYDLRARNSVQTRTYSILKIIGESVFANCTALSTVNIPEGVETIGNYAFKDCAALSSINLPSTISHIGAEAFGGTALNSIYYNGYMEDWNKIVIDNSNIFTNVEIICLDGTIGNGNADAECEHSYENHICSKCGMPEPGVLQILKQPENASAVLGETYCVEVIVAGDGLKYQWYICNKGETKFSRSSVTDNTYDDVMTSARMGRKVYCVITDDNGNKVTTDTVELIAVPGTELAIITQPQDTAVKFSENFCVTVEAEGDALKYQWYFKNAGDEEFTKSTVRDNSYDDVMTTARMDREIYCVITDGWGNTVTTDTVTLIAVPNTELAITKQPEDSSAKLDENFCVTVEAVGDGLKYKWYYRNENEDIWRASGVRDNTYDDVMTVTRMGREVYCVITDVWGNSVETETAELFAVPSEALAITTQPQDSSAKLGENFCTTVEATGDGLKYKWYYQNKGSDVWHVSGVRDNTYDDVMTAERAGRKVYCVITDIWGNVVQTDTVELIGVVNVPLAITKQPEDAFAKLDENFCVTVEAVGDDVKYQWYIRNAGAEKFSRSSVTDNTYDDVMTRRRANREVYCVITDALGYSVTTNTVTLHMQ